jgi:hypothetical protein
MEDWSSDLVVFEEELAEAVGKIEARKAPGLDGVAARLWDGVAGELALRLRHLFDTLVWYEFPGVWITDGSSSETGTASEFAFGLLADMFAGSGGQAAQESSSCPPLGASVSRSAWTIGGSIRIPEGALRD